MFAYCGNNPIYYIDESGTFRRPLIKYMVDGGPAPVTKSLIANSPEEQAWGVINGQANLPYADTKIGLGTYGKSGCPYIATYNAMQLLRQPQSLASITSEMFEFLPVLWGAGGTGPWATAAYFNSHGIEYTGSLSSKKLTSNITEGSIIVFTAMYSGGWHAMTALYTNGEYWVFNRYNEDDEHRTYSSLNEAYRKGFWIYGFRIDP